MLTIFHDYLDFMIVIFDNLLVLATDYSDAFSKFQLVVTRCREYNIVLKFSKSYLGFSEARFFGYVVRHGTYELSQQRKESIQVLPMPTSQKQMQRFLGTILFFKSFIPLYSELTADLTEMLRDNFVWDPATWKRDYRAAFERIKATILQSCALVFPNYELEWIVRADASERAVGGVLLQLAPQPDGGTIPQPLAFASAKLSDAATRWDNFKREAFALYWVVKQFSYFLYGKFFHLETDHANLQWMEKSDVPIVIRWRVFLQSFSFLLRHIPGKVNIVADFLSRMYALYREDTFFDAVLTSGLMPSQIALCFLLYSDAEPFRSSCVSHLSLPTTLTTSVGDGQSLTISTQSSDATTTDTVPAYVATERDRTILSELHGGRHMHFGARRTWLALNRQYPGHRIPYRVVEDFVATCPLCQKDRLPLKDSLKPVVRHLKVQHSRASIGTDGLTITPTDRNGNNNCIVIIESFTRYAVLYAAKDYTAETVATALFQFYCTHGVFEKLLSDPGSNLMAEVVALLNKWFGVPHLVSLVDRHESNGVEATNREILRHLKMLVHDERLLNRWSDPTVLPLINFQLNNQIHSETGVRPFEAKFGTFDATYLRLPEQLDAKLATPKFIRMLDQDLRTVREISTKFQQELIQQRTSVTPVEQQNVFQPGDLVLHFEPKPRQFKLTSPFSGPYEVLKQDKNDVTARHIVLGHVQTMFVGRLKLFYGTKDQAYQAALLDKDQFVIKNIMGHRGDPLLRSTMSFHIEFADGTQIWLPWSRDLFESIPYEEYCRRSPELHVLVYTVNEARKMQTRIKRSPITEIQPGESVYVDLRSFGPIWYDTLPIPDKYTRKYVVLFTYTAWPSPNHLTISATCPIFNETFPRLDHFFVHCYGTIKAFNSANMILIDTDFVRQYPCVLPSK